VKKSGRNGVQLFAPEMSTFFPERLTLENDLRRAIENGELELHYQPTVDVDSGKITGMEALLRWRHPEKGLIMPMEFIPLAEETGLIVPLGEWVLREACAQNKAWQDRGLPRLRVSVNISGVQWRKDDIVECVARALRESGLDASYLELEITESVVMQNAAKTVGMLEQLSRMGVHLSIDDFGTGYSSLSYLKRFQVNTLKIDRAFIRDIASDHEDSAIVQAIVALAHSLQLQVVAEGVENDTQLQHLKRLGSDEYQGFFRSKPLPGEQFERFLKAEMQAGDRPLPLPSGAA
jgi:EAL domain-containing protein (putative c-di-GMP-specific phosphodiesterase class I)